MERGVDRGMGKRTEGQEGSRRAGGQGWEDLLGKWVCFIVAYICQIAH